MSFIGNDRSHYGSSRWVEFKNTASETCPAYGLLMVSLPGMDSVSNRYYVTAGKPGATPTVLAINGPTPVQAGGFGLCTFDYPTVVACDGTPVRGETWGSEDDSWEAVKPGRGELVVIGSVGDGVMMAVGTGGGGRNPRGVAKTDWTPFQVITMQVHDKDGYTGEEIEVIAPGTDGTDMAGCWVQGVGIVGYDEPAQAIQLECEPTGTVE